MTQKPLANDMSLLLDKIARRLGLLPLLPHLPHNKDFDLSKDAWADVIKNDTLVTFSRYFPYEFKMAVNEDTCYKQYGDKHSHAHPKDQDTMWYIIKDEVLEGTKLLGIKDIDWQTVGLANASLSTSLGGGLYVPVSAFCPFGTFESVTGLQMAADMASLYNNQLYIDFQYPNRFAIKGLGNTNYDLTSFVVILLLQHRDLSTISPTKFEVFEGLCQCDIANFLWKNLRYYDGLDTIYVNIDLKLAELQEEAQKRDQVIDLIRESYVGGANDSASLIWTV
jgi:hypothetical protein